MVSLGMVLEQYPNEVVIYITDPRTGVQRKAKWPPTISEIVEACDARIAELKRADRFRNWGSNEPLAIEPPREDRLSLEELKAKYGKDWGLNLTESHAPSGFFEHKTPTWDDITKNYSANPSLLAALLKSDSE